MSITEPIDHVVIGLDDESKGRVITITLKMQTHYGALLLLDHLQKQIDEKQILDLNVVFPEGTTKTISRK